MAQALVDEADRFVGTFAVDHSIGTGLWGQEFEVTEIFVVTFVCDNLNGKWTEVTGFPNALKEGKLSQPCDLENFQPIAEVKQWYPTVNLVVSYMRISVQRSART